MPLRTVFVSILLATFAYRGVQASNVSVPSPYATIQAAIGSGADTVLVSYGNYLETLNVTRSVALIGVSPPFAGEPTNNLCRVTRIAAQGSGSTILLRGFEFTGSAVINNVNRQQVENCRFDSALTARANTGHLWNSTVFGNASLSMSPADVAMNAIVGGGLFVAASGAKSGVHDNVVIGPANVGITASEDVNVTRNYVKDCAVGIRAGVYPSSDVVGNVVEDCSGTGIDGIGTAGSSSNVFSANVVRRCVGYGMDLNRAYQVIGNIVEDVGLDGIRASRPTSPVDKLTDNSVSRAGGSGINTGPVSHATGNRAVGSRGDGIVLQGSQEVRNNIVGRSGGRGLAVGTLGGPLSIRANTAYLNTGAGFEVAGNASGDSITHNIAQGNAVGLKWAASGTPFLGCDDWYGNSGGGVIGTTAGATDVSLNPQFCNLAGDNVYLSSASALVNLSGCGQVGALGVGCSNPAGVEDRTSGAVRTLQIVPQPGRGSFRLHWPILAAPAGIEVFDATGALRWRSAVAAGSSSTDWDGRDTGGEMVPPGVYFARLSTGAERIQARIVVIR
jgi:hypothetical protein